MIRLDDMLGFQQLQRDIGIADPSGGVDPGCHAEGDVGRSEFRTDFRTFDQCAYSGAKLFAQCLDAELHHNPIFSEQRHDIRNGAESHVIKHLLEPGLKSAEIVFASVLDEGVREFERSARAGEHLQILEFRIDLGIDDRQSLRQFCAGLMVVGDDDIDSPGNCVIDGIAAGNAAIDRDEDSAVAVGIECLLKGFGGKAVSIVKSVGDERMHDCAVLTENQRQQCACGDPVSIVISVNEDRFATCNGVPQTLRSLPDARETVGIAQLREAGRKKILDLIFTDSAGGEVDGDRTGQRELPLHCFDLAFQIIPGEFPIFYTHFTLSILITHTIR